MDHNIIAALNSGYKSSKGVYIDMSGQKLYTAIKDYTVIDLETCGCSGEDRKKIIEITALRFRDDKLVDKFSTLVNPQCHIPSQTTKVNNITDSMVADAPTIDKIFKAFLDFIGDDVLVGHNIGGFDYGIINNLAIELLDLKIQNSYIDTFRLAQRCLPELQNHRLDTLSDYLGLSTEGMHRSEYDCMLTHQLYLSLKPLCNSTISPSFYCPKPKSKEKYSYAKADKAFINNNPFLGKICIVYGAFQQLSLDQIHNIFDVIGARFVDFFCYSADFLILGSDMHKKYVSGIEDDIINSFLALRKPVLSEYEFVNYSHIDFSSERNASDFVTIDDITGKTICLTGDFDIDSNRDRIINRIVELGGIVKKDVIKSLDYLVVGNKGSINYKDGTKGHKAEKAEQFNLKGSNIKIISENDFLKKTEVNENE